eukprot:6000533-Amphidinium_carterae.1
MIYEPYKIRRTTGHSLIRFRHCQGFLLYSDARLIAILQCKWNHTLRTTHHANPLQKVIAYNCDGND